MAVQTLKGAEPMIEYQRHAAGPRVKVAGYRIHHGAAGMFLLGLGLVLALHDWRDRRSWLRGR